MSNEVIYEIEKGVVTVTLNRPEVRNARNAETRRKLMEAFQQAKADPSARVLILTGIGNTFSAGRDLKEVNLIKESPAAVLRHRWDGKDSEALASLDIPTIAAINGYALGGGLELALCCDFRIAVEEAQIGLTEVRRGMIPGSGGTQRLARIVGMAQALEMILTGKIVTAEEALAIGLINQIVKNDVVDAAKSFAVPLVEAAPVAVRFAKEAIYRGMDLPLAEGLKLEGQLSTILETTDDYHEGARAFSEKRSPQFTGQ